MNIGVFWRSYRNVEFQKMLSPDEVKDDAFEEALSHSQALGEAGFKTSLIEWKDNPQEVFKLLKEKQIDIVFNASSEKELNFLETFNIPYTGTSSSTVALNKAYRKIILSHYGVTTPNFALARSIDSIPDIDFNYPIFVKPLDGRGSGGTDDSNIVNRLEDLQGVVDKITKGIGQVALIEEFIKGREITVGIIGYKEPEILPIAEIVYNNSRTNTYAHKMNDKETIVCPAKLSKETERALREVSLKIYKVLDIYDYGRIDFILDKNNVPYFLEINTFAGLTMPDHKKEQRTHYGYMGYMAQAKAYTRAEFLKKIIDSTKYRYRLSEEYEYYYSLK